MLLLKFSTPWAVPGVDSSPWLPITNFTTTVSGTGCAMIHLDCLEDFTRHFYTILFINKYNGRLGWLLGGGLIAIYPNTAQ